MSPDAKVIRAPMGGSWIIPLTDEGRDTLAAYYDEPAAEIAPLGGAIGYIVEPYDSANLAEYLQIKGIAWTIE